MVRNPRHDILFEPVKIGPVTAKNRFYQVPHCTGMGFAMPQTVATMRKMKAEGGWGVVNTEYCSMHPTADDGPFAFCTLWDKDDVRNMAIMTEMVHEHGALAGVQLWHGGMHAANRNSRMPVISVSGESSFYPGPTQTKAMDKQDIRNLLRWQRDAAIRAKESEFDLVYVYVGHDYLPFQFLSHRHNYRTDEYGGSMENRTRLVRELIEVTKDAIGDRCAVAIRFAVDELMGKQGMCSGGEGHDIVEMLAELPDLWDVNVSGVANDSKSARFSEEGFQEDFTGFVKSVTSKPVVGVGRYTSPDRMASLIRKGVLDLIGAARPSIADPFLPRKIEEGRSDEIRECIGCNICRSSNNEGAPIRCTQNPTMGEEWRRGWHPENIPSKGSNDTVLVVGGGPAGLECARAAGQRGYSVVLAESGLTLGGRINQDSRLPGFSTWARVRDWRVGRLQQMTNVEIYMDSHLGARDVAEFGFDKVVIATGAKWRRDGWGRNNQFGIADIESSNPLTPDDILGGEVEISGSVLIYDDDDYYMGGAMAELLRGLGHTVTIATPSPVVSSWTYMTEEQVFIQTKLMTMGVTVIKSHTLVGAKDNTAHLACVYTGNEIMEHFDNLLLVTMRKPNDALYQELIDGGSENITRIGDCEVPAAIVHAVHSGHLYARELDNAPENIDMPYKRERFVV